MKWNDDKTITITPPKRPKKITGTRLAAIMGLNKWTTPFNAWCAITRRVTCVPRFLPSSVARRKPRIM